MRPPAVRARATQCLDWSSRTTARVVGRVSNEHREVGRTAPSSARVGWHQGPGGRNPDRRRNRDRDLADLQRPDQDRSRHVLDRGPASGCPDGTGIRSGHRLHLRAARISGLAGTICSVDQRGGPGVRRRDPFRGVSDILAPRSAVGRSTYRYDPRPTCRLHLPVDRWMAAIRDPDLRSRGDGSVPPRGASVGSPLRHRARRHHRDCCPGKGQHRSGRLDDRHDRSRGTARRPGVSLAVFVSSAVLSFVGLWLVAGQHLGSVPAYFQTALDIAKGYRESMGPEDRRRVGLRALHCSRR